MGQRRNILYLNSSIGKEQDYKEELEQCNTDKKIYFHHFTELQKDFYLISWKIKLCFLEGVFNSQLFGFEMLC